MKYIIELLSLQKGGNIILLFILFEVDAFIILQQSKSKSCAENCKNMDKV